MKILLIFLSLLSSMPVFAQVEEIEKPKFLSIFTNTPGDLKDWYNGTFSQENLPNLLGVLGLTAVLVPTDYQTWQAVAKPVSESRDAQNFFKNTEQLSAGIFQLGAGLTFLTWGFSGNNKALRTAYQIGETVLSSGIIVQLMKRATGRESPRSSLQRGGRWRGYPGENRYRSELRDYDAMPSGHMSSAFATYIVIQENYPDQEWIPYVGYPLMGIMVLGCVGTNIHWFSDMPIAFALAYSFGKTVTKRNHPQASETTSAWDPHIGVTLNDTADTPLVTAHWSF